MSQEIVLYAQVPRSSHSPAFSDVSLAVCDTLRNLVCTSLSNADAGWSMLPQGLDHSRGDGTTAHANGFAVYAVNAKSNEPAEGSAAQSKSLLVRGVFVSVSRLEQLDAPLNGRADEAVALRVHLCVSPTAAHLHELPLTLRASRWLPEMPTKRTLFPLGDLECDDSLFGEDPDLIPSTYRLCVAGRSSCRILRECQPSDRSALLIAPGFPRAEITHVSRTFPLGGDTERDAHLERLCAEFITKACSSSSRGEISLLQRFYAYRMRPRLRSSYWALLRISSGFGDQLSCCTHIVPSEFLLTDVLLYHHFPRTTCRPRHTDAAAMFCTASTVSRTTFGDGNATPTCGETVGGGAPFGLRRLHFRPPSVLRSSCCTDRFSADTPHSSIVAEFVACILGAVANDGRRDIELVQFATSLDAFVPVVPLAAATKSATRCDVGNKRARNESASPIES